MIFITEGNSASGSITKSRDVRTQAVFSLRASRSTASASRRRSYMRTRSSTCCRRRSTSRRIWTTCGTTGRDRHRCRCRWHAHPSVADDLLPAIFPDVIRGGHLYVLQTPLFRVRNKKETHYCYSEEEKNRRLHDAAPTPKSPVSKVWVRFLPTSSGDSSARISAWTRCGLRRTTRSTICWSSTWVRTPMSGRASLSVTCVSREDIVESDLAIG